MKTPKIRTRVGSLRTFETRFELIDPENINGLLDFNDVKDKELHLIWTVLEGSKRLYVSPGFHTVNKLGYILCKKPWSDLDLHQPDYIWD